MYPKILWISQAGMEQSSPKLIAFYFQIVLDSIPTEVIEAF